MEHSAPGYEHMVLCGRVRLKILMIMRSHEILSWLSLPEASSAKHQCCSSGPPSSKHGRTA